MLRISRGIAAFLLATSATAPIACADDASARVSALRPQIEAAKSAATMGATSSIEFTIKVTTTVTIKSSGLSLPKVTCTLNATDGTYSITDLEQYTATVSSGSATCTNTMTVKWATTTSNTVNATLSISGTTATQERLHLEPLITGVAVPKTGSILSYTRAVTL